MIPGLQTFSNLRVDAVMEALQDVRQMPQALKMVNRLPEVDAFDNEIMARFVGHANIADIIAEDAEAVAYGHAKWDFINYNLCKIKHGAVFNESDIQRMMELGRLALAGSQSAVSQLTLTRNRILENLLMGVRWRWEALACAMMCDSLHYDKMGIKIDGTWGMPSGLKSTPTIPWDSTSATPISDILTQKDYRLQVFGAETDRITLSLTAFRYMIATTEFATKAEFYLRADQSFASMSQIQTEPMQRLAEAMTGCTIEFYDGRYWYENTDGSKASARFWPINKVCLDLKANDNNPNVWDLAQGVPLESILIDMAGSSMEGAPAMPAGRHGPMAFSHVPSHLNPPSLSMWAVSKTYPRKWDQTANSILTVGDFEDTIPVTDQSFLV